MDVRVVIAIVMHVPQQHLIVKLVWVVIIYKAQIVIHAVVLVQHVKVSLVNFGMELIVKTANPHVVGVHQLYIAWLVWQGILKVMGSVNATREHLVLVVLLVLLIVLHAQVSQIARVVMEWIRM